MEFIFEALVGPIVEAITEDWFVFMKKKNARYENRFLIRTVTILVAILIIILIVGGFLGILFLLEWLFPNLLDVVAF